MAGNVTLSPSGSLTDSRNSANWSEEMPTCGFAVQVTELTVPAALSRSRLAVQPGMTSVRADATLGSLTLIWLSERHFQTHPALGR